MAADRATLLLLIVAWYASSAACTACSKRLLATLAPHRCALQLTCAQFAVTSLLSASPFLVQRSLPKLPGRVLCHVGAISLSYTAGFALLNCSLLYVPASFAETLRGLEPLFSALVSCGLGVRGGALNRWCGLSVLVLVSGGAISCWSQPAASRDTGFYSGTSLALGANLAFALRGVFTTAAQDALARAWEDKLHANSVFFYQHACGFLVTLALWGLTGGARFIDPMTHHAPISFWLLLGSTGSFFLYNRLSLAVLLRLNAVAHSVCNALRRAATVAVAATLFATPVTTASLLGIVLVITGSAG
jgi:drug/metabolite transporter (DMT)-like permease